MGRLSTTECTYLPTYDFFFGKVCILEPNALATDVLPLGAGFAGSLVGWD